ncbi:hypothetical protein ALC53_07910, partial [Atta colombica]
KKFTLSLYFLSPRSYKELKKTRKISVSAKSILVVIKLENWKLPVCHCFIETACPATFLKNIFDIIIKLKNNGAFISDMSSNFIQLSHMLNISVDNSSFIVDGKRLVYIFNIPHLLKATRNNLLKYNFQVDNKIISWNFHIVEFYKRDSKEVFKGFKNLLINPTPIQFNCVNDDYCDNDDLLNIVGNTTETSTISCSIVNEQNLNFEKNGYKENIGNYLFHLIQNVAFESPCSDFPKDFLIKLFLRIRIYYTLSQHNKSCKIITRKNRKLLNIYNSS